ncbi:MAG: MFS transporter [Thermotogota bacterium]|nr:MFS transporter [Thermotogota bacterium]
MIYEAITEWFVYSIQALMNLLSQYYESEGFTPVQIGIAVSVGRIMSLVANPFWFKMKTLFGINKVITLVTLVPLISIWGIYFMPDFQGKMIFIIISGFFLAVVMPLIEGKVVSSLMKKGLAFNPSRLLGSIGFSIAAFIAGLLFNIGFFMLFLLFSVFLFVVLLFSFKVQQNEPKTKRAHMTDSKGNWFVYGIMLLSGILSISSAIFYVTFLPVYIDLKGYPLSFTGISFFIFALSEIPFLFFSQKLINKFGELLILASGVFACGIRLILSFYAQNIFQLILVSLLHGWGYIVVYYSIYHFIHYHMPVRAINKAQAIFWMSITGIGFILGSFFGGFFVEWVGLESGFLVLGWFVLFIALFYFIWAYAKSIQIKGIK